MLARIRKALMAGFGAAVAAGLGAIVTSGSLTRDEIGKALGVAITAAITVGIATYHVRNAGSVNGSYPAAAPAE